MPRHPEAPDEITAYCGDCEEDTQWTHDGEEPVVSTHGAWGKYVAVVYVCGGCGRSCQGHPVSGRWSC